MPKNNRYQSILTSVTNMPQIHTFILQPSPFSEKNSSGKNGYSIDPARKHNKKTGHNRDVTQGRAML